MFGSPSKKIIGNVSYNFTTDDPLLKYQSHIESSARSYPRRIPIAIKKAKGSIITDTQGRKFIDCLAGAGTLALGHNHPVIKDAISRHLAEDAPLHTLDLTTPAKDQFIRDVMDSLPPKFARNAKIQFCGPSGADAIEAALKLVKTATARSSICAFHGAYHGMTHGALALTGNLGPKNEVPSLMPDVHFLPFPYAYRCPMGLGGEAGSSACAHYIEHLLNDPESGITKPAAIFLEAVQGEGGVIPAPTKWLRRLRKVTQDLDIPLVLDEVQAGMGRTGKMWAFEHAGITPDVIVISKALGGSLPMSVVVYHEKLDAWGAGAHTGTFRGNQLGMVAGSATLQFIREQNLLAEVERKGDRLKQHLQNLQRQLNTIGDVRGMGLMLGVEMVNPAGAVDSNKSLPGYPELARLIQRECLQRGLILELGGRHGCTVRFLPPLTITDNELDQACHIFTDAVVSAEHQLLKFAEEPRCA